MPPSRREELVESAMAVFYRNGFHNTGLDMILKESGISRMTLYNHFKSKDELIVAALELRDRVFRDKLVAFVDASGADPIERILAVIEFHRCWFNEDNFNGCMFINASAEFCDPDSPARRVCAEHKVEIVRILEELCTSAKLDAPAELAQEINLLIEGAIVNTHVVARVPHNEHQLDDAITRVKLIATMLIERSVHGS